MAEAFEKPHAAAKNDQKILVHILNNDCSAIEVKNHKRCYERYTLCVRHADYEVDAEKYDSYKHRKSSESFCEYVKQEVVDGHNIVFMSQLRDKFVKIVQDTEMEDASNYKAFRLKKRLQNRFPRLVFHKPKRKRTSEIVYAEEISAGAVAERVVYYGGLSDSDDDEKGESTKEPIADERKIELKD